jgi:hypothetical protein
MPSVCDLVLVVMLHVSPGNYSVEVHCMPSFTTCVQRAAEEWEARPAEWLTIIECVRTNGLYGRVGRG